MPSVKAEDVVAFLKIVPPFQFLEETDLRKVAENLTIGYLHCTVANDLHLARGVRLTRDDGKSVYIFD